MSEKDKSHRWSEIIVTAVLATSLTLIGSYFIMKNQLSEEQKYWSQRFKAERSQNILDRKVALLEEVNTGILKSEILAKDIKLSFSTFHALMETCRIDQK